MAIVITARLFAKKDKYFYRAQWIATVIRLHAKFKVVK